uniref:Ig-like domain-containing protein n=1 Tax=Acanthochromis polyacanthus TaxID=80966 RepID=A0A3Q1G2Q5_9TELE
FSPYLIHVCIEMLFVVAGICCLTTVSEVSVKAGDSVTIPCLYDRAYINHVKYLCEGYYWSSLVIRLFTYWALNDFLFVCHQGTPSLYVDHQEVTGIIGENITINCHYRNSGIMKWCRLGKNCVTGSSGSIDGTRVTIDAWSSKVFTVTMSELKAESSGWYWCAIGNFQMPVHVTVTEKPTTSKHTNVGLKSLIIRLSVLVFIVIVSLIVWFMLRYSKCDYSYVPKFFVIL